MKLDPSQERAVELVRTARIGIVTGGPGTGKTTCLRAALGFLDADRITYRLASPTGKAAKRLQEATGREASTIHRLLTSLPYATRAPDLVVVDEASMIDIELFARLVSSISPSRTRLILVGDANQLPPVGPGRPFSDFVSWRGLPMVRLEVLHRSAQESWIHVAAQDLLRGRIPNLETRDDFRWYCVEDVKNLLPKVEWVITKARDASVAQVLIPQRPGPAGINAANTLLQNTLNPRKPDQPVWIRERERPDPDWEIRIGDPVIQTKNNYDLEVFNGEVGRVVWITSAELTVSFDDRDKPVVYKKNHVHALELAYALTIHRTQGSEFPWVIVVCHSTHSFILSRQLLYTAITRAKQGVILIGNRKGIERAVANQRPEQRNTTMVERLEETLEPVEEYDAAEGGTNEAVGTTPTMH